MQYIYSFGAEVEGKKVNIEVFDLDGFFQAAGDDLIWVVEVTDDEEYKELTYQVKKKDLKNLKSF